MTGPEAVRLEGVAATLLVPLYLRAVDAGARRPVLGDPYAAGVLARVDHDAAALRRGRANAPVAAMRGRWLDEAAQAFLDEHPAAQVLHLGCGLDSRPLRLRRPRGARWLDVDQPDVITLRRRLYDLPDDVTLVPASVTDADWWDEVDPARPTLLVAEGLLMYLEATDVRALVARAAAHLGSAELAFDGVSRGMVRLSHRLPATRRAHTVFTWPLADLPGTRVVDQVSLMTLLAREPVLAAPLRVVYLLLAHVPPLRDALTMRRLALPI